MKDGEFEPSTQAERLVESIADSVLSGDFPPGFRLDETATGRALSHRARERRSIEARAVPPTSSSTPPSRLRRYRVWWNAWPEPKTMLVARQHPRRVRRP